MPPSASVTYPPAVSRPISIERCVCSDVSFSHLKDVADETGIESLEELQQACTFGVTCRLCHPYVRRMLKDGTVRFHSVLTDDD